MAMPVGCHLLCQPGCSRSSAASAPGTNSRPLPFAGLSPDRMASSGPAPPLQRAARSNCILRCRVWRFRPEKRWTTRHHDFKGACFQPRPPSRSIAADQDERDNLDTRPPAGPVGACVASGQGKALASPKALSGLPRALAQASVMPAGFHGPALPTTRCHRWQAVILARQSFFKFGDARY